MAPAWSRQGAGESGWILAEIVPALVLSALLVGVLMQSAVTMRRCVGQWDRALQMRQMLTATLWTLGRDVRMGGCDPLGVSGLQGVRLVPDVSGEEGLRLEMDVRGTPVGSRPDGDIEDPDEQILYRWDAGRELLVRNSQPMAIRIRKNPGGESLFSLQRRGDRTLVSVFLTMGSGVADQAACLSMAFCVRNGS